MRLTNADRDAIIKQETVNKFHDRIIEADKKFGDFIEKQAEKCSAKNPKISDDLIVQGFIHTTNTISFAGDKCNRRYSGSSDKTRNLRNRYPSPFGSKFVVSKPCKTFFKLRDRIEEIKEEKKKWQSKFRSILYSYTTDTKLTKDLPELEKYFAERKSKSLSIIPFEDIKEIRRDLQKSNKENK